MKLKNVSSRMIWMFLILVLFSQSLLAQAAPITFRVENVESFVPFPPSTPWMFDTDDPGFPFQEDGNPFTHSENPVYAWHNYAYRDFYSTAAPGGAGALPTTTYCLEENLDYVADTDGFRVEFENFVLTGFQKKNMVDPLAAWNIRGQAGDIRTYTGGRGLVYHNNVLVLTVLDCILKVYVSYPNAAQMRQHVATWQLDVGSGAASTVEGWGIVDEATSDPQWFATFANAEAGNKLDFIMDTVDHVIQGQYGYYSFNVGLVAAEHAAINDHANVIAPGNIPFPELDVDFDFSAVGLGGPGLDLNDLTIIQIIDTPDGVIPDGIEHLAPRYWQFSTNLGSFTTNITFDLSGTPFGNSSTWRILRRGEMENTWQIWADYSILDANRIRANNVSEFSEWTIGSTDPETLPVQLSSFTALVNSNNLVTLQWQTASETNLSGYQVFRHHTDNLQNAMNLNQFIQADNSSLGSSYTFTDQELFAGVYYYWLCAIEFGGSAEFFGPVIAEISEPGGETPSPVDPQNSIVKVYPNPFNPDTRIAVYSPQKTTAQCSIYNHRGAHVITFGLDQFAQGWNYFKWDGKDHSGTSVSSGLYHLRISGKDLNLSAKLMLVK